MNFVNTSLFVGDLPKFCSESDLEQIFVPYGPILDVKIKRNVNTGKTLSYGFVTLSTEAFASEAIRALDGAMFSGRKMRVRWAMYNARTQNPISHGVINSVYVRFVTAKPDYVTEEDLHQVFDPFGGVLDVSIKESSVDPRTNRQSGYGFVHFACDSQGIESAFQAVAALDNSTVEGITFNVELSKNLLKQFNASQDMTKEGDAISPAKQLSSPSRSSHDLRQQFPVTPVRSVELDRVPSMDMSPYGAVIPDLVAGPSLRSFPSNNSIKFSPNQPVPYSLSKPPVSEQHSLPRTLSGRTLPPQAPTGFQNGYPNVTVTAAKNFSRENSFRSTNGLRSSGGSFRTLNARSTSQNSMSSSYGTTVSCTSTPAPFHNHVVPTEPVFDKTQSFRSDPGANRIYMRSNNVFGQIEQTTLLGHGSHSLSFQEPPIQRTLFTTQASRFGGSETSLVSTSSHNLVAELGGSFHGQVNVPQRPDSRASDCSDVTDGDEAVLVLNDNHPDDFFSAFLSKKIPENKHSAPFDTTKLLDLDTVNFNDLSIH